MLPSEVAASGTTKEKEPPKQTNVQVAVRCRPPNAQEKASNQPLCITSDQDARSITAAYGAPGKKVNKNFHFDKVFGMYSTQGEVFKGVVEPIVQEVLEGFNCTIFAYGQTGTGKTHTMEGNIHDQENAGIVPRAVRSIFEQLEAGEAEFTVRVSFLELYNEELQDLLVPNNGKPPETKLKLCEDAKKGGVVCQGLEEVTVINVKDILSILERGIQQRQTAATLCNKNSSRSHSIFTLKLNIREVNPQGEEVVRHGQLNLVDLAGSECVGRSGAKNDRAREAGSINQSLLTLGRVITALVDHHQHIPYRDSKLTRLLQDSLGGKAKTCIIATLSPCNAAIEESMSTLDYASRAKNIKNAPQQNQKMTKKVVLKEYCAEIENLRHQLQITREKNGIYVDPETYYNLESKVSSQEAQLKECESALKRTGDEITDLKASKDELEGELNSVKENLSTTTAELEQNQIKCDELKEEYNKKALELSATEAVVTEMSSNEQCLLNAGNHLQADIQGHRSNLSLLLNKVDVFVNKEQEAARNTDSFVANMKSQQEVIFTNIHQLSAQCDANSTTLCDGIKNMLDGGKASCSTLKKAIDNALKKLLGNSKSATGTMADSCAQLNGDMKQTNELIKDTLMDLQTELSEWLGNVDTAINSSANVLKLQSEKISALAAAIGDNVESHVRAINGFVIENNQLTAKCVETTESLRQTMTTTIESIEQENSKMLEDNNKQMVDKAGVLKEQFESMLNALVKDSTKQTQSMVKSNAKQFKTMHSVLDTQSDALSAAINLTAAHVEDKMNAFLPSLSSTKTSAMEQISEIDSICDEATVKCTEVGQNVVSRKEKLDSTVKSLVSDVSKITNKSIALVSDTSSVATDLYTSIEGITENMNTVTSKSLEEFTGLVNNEGEKLEMKLGEHFEYVKDFNSRMLNDGGAIAAVNATVCDYVESTNKLKIVSVGSTPKKANCQLDKPLVPLQATRNHNLIKEEVYGGNWTEPTVHEMLSPVKFVLDVAPMEMDAAVSNASSEESSPIVSTETSSTTSATTDSSKIDRFSIEAVSEVSSPGGSSVTTGAESVRSSIESDEGSNKRKFGTITNGNVMRDSCGTPAKSKVLKVAPVLDGEENKVETASLRRTGSRLAKPKTRSAR